MALTRTLMLPALVLMLAVPLSVQARSLDAPKAPPHEPVYEVDPGERPGYTRVVGHWEWTGDNYMWSPGKWVADKDGDLWVNDSWSQRGKKWHLTPGHYESDGSVPPPITNEAAESPYSVQESHGEAKERAIAEHTNETMATKNNGDEMDEVEGKVLAPARKPVSSTLPTHRVKRQPPAKKPTDFNNPVEYPFYHHH